MTTRPFPTALMAAMQFASTDDAAPEWVHLLPTGKGVIKTGDGRGPYIMEDAEAVIAASFAETDRLIIDQDHATDLAAPKGLPAPARGWIVEMQARADGIWGRVEWTDEGKQLVSSRAYRGLSPVIFHGIATNKIMAVLRASLVNRPNFKGLISLNQENDMSLSAQLAALLGLGEAATTDAAIVEAVTSLKGGTALQSSLSDIGVALGVAKDATPEVILNAARTAKTAAPDVVVALQAELKDVADKLNALQGQTALQAATTFVDGAIRQGRVGVKPLRDHYISMHQADPARVEKEIGAMPTVTGGILTTAPPEGGDGKVSLNAEEAAMATMLGIDPETYAAQLKADRAKAEVN